MKPKPPRQQPQSQELRLQKQQLKQKQAKKKQKQQTQQQKKQKQQQQQQEVVRTVKNPKKQQQQQQEVVRTVKNPKKQPGYLAPKILSVGDGAPKRKAAWTNKERVLTVASRGVSYLGRHLLKDLQSLLPHSRPDSKFAGKEQLALLNEVAEMKNASKILYLETRRKQDMYLWLSDRTKGPSAKFLVENVHTMSELKLTGNCLQGSRHLLAFDAAFDGEPHLRLLRELLTQVFGVPNQHPRSKPFCDHVLTFAWLDGRVWFRNYQLVEENGALAEIGPRFTLNPVKFFASSFTGPCLYENPAYVTPASARAQLKAKDRFKYVNKLQARQRRRLHADLPTFVGDATDDVFQ